MQPPEHSKRLLRTPEAAAHCGVSRSLLEKLRLTGTGPRYAKLGKIVTYDLADLNAWVEGNKRMSTSERGGGR